jgi:Ca2+-binding EF-hand superfamily protein
MRNLTLALSAIPLALAGPVFGQAAPAERAERAPRPDLTRAEAQRRAEAAFARMDANKDGTLSEADRAARRSAMFDRIDTDRDGSISRAEFEAMHAKRGEHRAHRGAMKRGAHQAMLGGREGGPLTQQAFVARALQMFDRADADRDGTVTQAERRAARESLRQRWQERRAARQQG